jgi:hypothetical protein
MNGVAHPHRVGEVGRVGALQTERIRTYDRGKGRSAVCLEYATLDEERVAKAFIDYLNTGPDADPDRNFRSKHERLYGSANGFR